MLRKRWRAGSGDKTMAEERRLKSEKKEPVRLAKLAVKRAGAAKKAAELVRIKEIALIETYSAIKKLRNDEISDQLKIYKVR